MVTGASQGIGKAIALAFGELGANVVLNARSESTLEEVGQIIDSTGQRVAIIAGDISRRTIPEVKEEKVTISEAIPGPGDLMVAAAKERWQRLDIVIHSAGDEANNLFMRQTDEDWDKALAIKLTGARNIMKPAVSAMYRTKEGVLIGLSSVAVDRGNFGQSAYSAANAAMEKMMESAQIEMVQMQRPDVRFTALRLGPVNAGMMLRLKESSPEHYQMLADRMPNSELIPLETVTDRVLEIASGVNLQPSVIEKFYGGFSFG